METELTKEKPPAFIRSYSSCKSNISSSRIGLAALDICKHCTKLRDCSSSIYRKKARGIRILFALTERHCN
uniref:Uncharacterized protein n=1 Tax=Romanomermis culicivorax TaxID=13658 RepID=A0A915I8I7_ROMCU